MSKPLTFSPEISICDLVSEVEAEFDRLRAQNRRLAISLQAAQNQVAELEQQVSTLRNGLAPDPASRPKPAKRKKPSRAKTKKSAQKKNAPVPPLEIAAAPPKPAAPRRKALGTSLFNLRPKPPDTPPAL